MFLAGIRAIGPVGLYCGLSIPRRIREVDGGDKCGPLYGAKAWMLCDRALMRAWKWH